MKHTPEIIQPESTLSTNSHLRELLKQRRLNECSVVITHSQTQGKGQPGNTWESEPGKNLTFSMVLYPTQIKASQQFILSKCISVAIAEVLSAILPRVTIKWPNDLYCGNKKIGGILIENTLQGTIIEQCIAGIGLNVNQEVFHSDAPNPISIKGITGHETDLLELFKEIFESLLTHYEKISLPGNLHDRYLQYLYRREGWFSYRDVHGPFEACFESIEPAGHLILRRRNGSLSRYAFKEVAFINP
jgi:BirA family biotin operon repressor/biotin-[acetyl-CoA-carboxylase] ligase